MMGTLRPLFWAATVAWVVGSGCGGAAVHLDAQGFRFTVEGREAQVRSGAGVIHQDLVIVDARVVRRGERIQATFPDERPVAPCDLLRIDDAVGVAVLRARGQPGKSLTFASAGNVAEGDVVEIPSLVRLEGNHDVVSVERVTAGADPAILLKGPIGVSRGPVFDGLGRFLGLLRDVYVVKGAPFGVVIPAWRIEPVVERALAMKPSPLDAARRAFEPVGSSLVKVQERSLCPESGQSVAFSLELLNDQDYFITVTAPGGNYTVQVRGKSLRTSDPHAAASESPGNPFAATSPFRECRLGQAACFPVTATDVPLTGTLRADADATGCATLVVRRMSWQ